MMMTTMTTMMMTSATIKANDNLLLLFHPPPLPPHTIPLSQQELPKFWLPIIRSLEWVDGPVVENLKAVMHLPTEADTDTRVVLESLAIFTNGVAYFVQTIVHLSSPWLRPIRATSVSFSFRAAAAGE